MSTQLAIPLPTLPGKVHGIVSLDPPTIQCDGCGLLEAKHPKPALAILMSHIIFCPRLAADGTDKRRLCEECRREAHWPTT